MNLLLSVSVCLQSLHSMALFSGSFLTESERNVLQWGKNAKVKYPSRFSGGGQKTYRNATALECLVRFKLHRTK